MKIALAQLLIASVVVQSAAVLASEHPELKAFPLAEEGFERFVITLPHEERGEDDAYGVEIIVGREMLTDGVNLVRLGNAIEQRTLDGWGYILVLRCERRLKHHQHHDGSSRGSASGQDIRYRFATTCALQQPPSNRRLRANRI